MAVIYLTGAPATGKSTLCRSVEQLASNVVILSYSQMLREHLRSRDVLLEGEDIRRESATVVTPDDVEQVDTKLLRRVRDDRHTKTIIIDSHPVTKETFGFRVTPFKHDHLLELSPDKIFCLYAAPEVLSQRIRDAPDGRPLPKDFELATHIQSQIGVAVSYATALGRCCYLLDSSVPPESLVAEFIKLARLG